MKEINNSNGKRKDVQDLWDRYTGNGKNVNLRNELVVYYMPLVRMSVARLAEKLPMHISYEEVCSAGYGGLIDAVEKYDPKRKAKFETFCQQRIRGAVRDWLRTLDTQSRTVREFEGERRRASETLSSKLNRKPTDSELAYELNIGMEKYDALSRLSKIGHRARFSNFIEVKSYNWKNWNEAECMPDINTPSPSDKINRKMFTNFITGGLNRDEKLAVILYYYEGLTLAEIGKAMGISESRTSQIRREAIGRIRKKFEHRRVPI